MIEKIALKSGLEFEPGNVTIIVGPNNSGKSTLLNDVKFELTEPDVGYHKIVVDNIVVSNYTEDEAKNFWRINGKEFISPTGQQPQQAYQGHLFFKTKNGGWNQYSEHQIISALTTGDNLKTRYRVLEAVTSKVLDGNSRLSLYTSQRFNFRPKDDDELTNIEKLHENKDLREEFTRYIEESLNLYPELFPENGQGQISLMNSPLDDSQRDSIKPEVLDLLETGKTQDDVSDGLKAFIGILLELVAGEPELILIDEVDAFLHAPLARKLGSILSGIAKNKGKQVFITTHNPHFIMGCIDSDSEFNILRLTYDGEKGDANLIDKNELREIVKNPLLRSTGVFDGLFYKNVVVCEADSDRVFYQEINHRLREADDERKIDDCLFVNARNKQTVGEITELLRRFGIPTASVIDFDFIKDGDNVFTKYLKSNGVPTGLFDSIRSKKTAVQSSFRKDIDVQDEQIKIENMIKATSEFLSSKTIGAARDLNRKIEKQLKSSEWASELKLKGVKHLYGEDKEVGDSLLKEVNNYGLFPVTVGEVESWLPEIEVNKHGNKWIIEKLELMGKDVTSDNYTSPQNGDVWDFIGDISKWLNNPERKGMRI